MAGKKVKTGPMPWQGKMANYSGNTRGGTGASFSAKGKGGKSGSKHGGCGCGGKK